MRERAFLAFRGVCRKPAFRGRLVRGWRVARVTATLPARDPRASIRWAPRRMQPPSRLLADSVNAMGRIRLILSRDVRDTFRRTGQPITGRAPSDRREPQAAIADRIDVTGAAGNGVGFAAGALVGLSTSSGSSLAAGCTDYRRRCVALCDGDRVDARHHRRPAITTSSDAMGRVASADRWGRPPLRLRRSQSLRRA